MLRRVKITSVPKARTGYQVKGSLANDVPAMGGADYNAYIGQPKPEVRKNLTAVPREQANLEAEGGETVVGNIDGSMMPSFYGIKGPRHHSGGVPLSLPDDSFIFSDTQSMKISDPTILKMFNKPPKKGGYTPAELSKQYDLNKYRQILQDQDTDKIARKTAELMIKNYVMKLGALALAQEAKKGFPQGIPVIAQPYMEANQIAPEQVMPELAQQAPEQGMEQQQGMMPEPQIEQGMEQGMPEEQMQMAPEMMEQAPMAAFGMEMGGYGIPFYNNPNEMSYGGTPRPIKRFQNGGLTEANLSADDLKAIESKWNNNKKAYIDYMNTKTGITGNNVLLDAMYEEYKKDIADKSSYTQGRQNEQLYSGYQPELAKLTKEQMLEQLLAQEERNARLAAYNFDPAKTDQRISQSNKGSRTNQQALDLISRTPGLSDLDFTGGYKGQAAYIAYRNTLNKPEFKQHGQFQVGKDDETVGGVRGAITGIDNANTNTTLGQRVNYVASPAPAPATPTTTNDTPCPCVDQNGKAMLKADGTPEVAQKDKDGKCLPCTTKKTTCECEDGTDPGKNEDGTCKECVGSEAAAGPKPEPEWWLQDTVNTMGAFGDTMSLKKYMPYEARVDLEEPRPTFKDQTQRQAQGNAAANIASQAAAQFAGPQALNARLSAIQGQRAQDASAVSSQFDNENVGIANQFEANQVGVRNQESMANQQMANRVYDKNVIANQQFDNSKTQGRANQRQAYNTAVTNKWKTDALNQMYPNYQTRPGAGGRVEYTPTDKKVDAGKEQDDMFKYRNELKAAGWSPEEIKAQMDRKYGKAKKHGGEKHTGYIYTDWPIFL
jgi:hypothetical protein